MLISHYVVTLDGQVNIVLIQNNDEHMLQSFLGTEPHFQEIRLYGLGIDTTYDTEVNTRVKQNDSLFPYCCSL